MKGVSYELKNRDDICLRGGLDMLKKLFSPFKSVSFKALWIGQSFSRLGDCIMNVMLPLIVYSITGSALTMGVVMTLIMTPQIVLTPVTGILADYISRRKLMIIADVVRLFTLSIFSISKNINIPTIYIYAVISGTMTSIFQPAYSAVRAEVFTAEIRNSANSLTQISEQFARLVGPSLGALIISFTSISIGFGIDAITFFVSVVSLFFLKIEKPIQRSVDSKHRILFFKNELTGGLQEIKKQTWLWVTILISAFINIVMSSIILILLPGLIKINYKMPPYTYGILITANGAGSLIIAFVFSLRQKWKHRGLIAYTGYIFLGIALSGIAFISWFPYLVFVMVISGAIGMLFLLIWEGSLQELIPIDSFGKVVSLDMMGSYILLPLGFLVTGRLSQSIGGLSTLLYEAIFLTILIAMSLLIPSIRKFN